MSFLLEFRARDGVYIAFTTLLTKLISLIISIYVVRLIDQKEFGFISFSLSIVAILSAFSGLGMNWSLLRFGAITNLLQIKKGYYIKSISLGVKVTLLLMFCMILGSFFLPTQMRDAQGYLIILSFCLLGNFLFESVKSFSRILKRNKSYANLNVVYILTLLLISIIGVSLLGSYGYVLALVVAPFIPFFLFHRNVNVSKFAKDLPDNYIKYGLQTSFGMVSNQAVILVGPLLLSIYGDIPENIASFKVVTLIPFNLMILPTVIFITDFVHLSENYRNKRLLINYYTNYVKSILIVTIIPLLLAIAYTKELLGVLFGNEYLNVSDEFQVLIVAIYVALFLRIPSGNILSAVGKADWNVYNSYFWLIAYLPLSYFLFQYYGLYGFTLSLGIIFVLSGVVGFVLFIKYLNSIAS